MIDVNMLKNNEDIKYIYLIPNSLFRDKYQYIIIGDIPTAYEDNVFCYSLEDWFKKMESGDLLPYACAILKKKYKQKEFLNIYNKPDMLVFRKYILNSELPDWEIEQQLNWAIQIMDEYTINRFDAFLYGSNFKAVYSDFINKVEGMVRFQLDSFK